MNRRTFTVMEHATGIAVNPYEGYLESEIYYAGPFSYIIAQGNTYYNISTKKNLSGTNIKILKDNIALFDENDNDTTIISKEDIIRTMPFGDNANGTCSSVASGIYLSFLDKTVDDNFVPRNLEYGEKLHQYLIDYIESKITEGSQPIKIKMGLDKYFSENIELKKYIDAKSDFVLLNGLFITEEINNDKPVIICLGKILGSAEYEDHTVVTYGYRDEYVTIQGNQVKKSTEYQIHAGWYPNI